MPEAADRDDAISQLGLCEEIVEIADNDEMSEADRLSLIKIKAEALRLLAVAIKNRN